MEEIYKVASTEFIRKGGDGYTALSKGQVIQHPNNGTLLHTILTQYLQKNKTIEPSTSNRIIFL